jgi:hypothetical protein
MCLIILFKDNSEKRTFYQNEAKNKVKGLFFSMKWKNEKTETSYTSRGKRKPSYAIYE